jgi:Uncharacterized protein conserved in bacteria
MARLPAALRALPDVLRRQDQEVAALLDALDALPPPRVVAGDLNATPSLPAPVALRTRLRDAWAVGGKGLAGTVRPLGLPLQVDQVFADASLGVAAAQVLTDDCSDHHGVLVDFVVRPDRP